MVERDTNTVRRRRARPTCSTPQRIRPPHAHHDVLSQHGSKGGSGKLQSLRKQVEALEAGGKDRPKRGLQAPTPPKLGNVALRFDLLSARFSATLAHPCRWLLQSARFKAYVLFGRLSRCQNPELITRRTRPTTCQSERYGCKFVITIDLSPRL
jgi:hypothetical protein